MKGSLGTESQMKTPLGLNLRMSKLVTLVTTHTLTTTTRLNLYCLFWLDRGTVVGDSRKEQ